MNKELQDLAWSVLPKEFKEEVKKMYRIADSDVDQMIATIMLENVFGIHNLTSDSEGEEMLCVSRKQVQEMYKNNCNEIRRENISSSDKDCYEYANEVLKTLFGSKCLPDEKGIAEKANCPEPKYHVGQRMYIKYINKIGTIDIVQGYNKEEDGIYYHLKVEPKGVASAREEYLQPYEEPKPAEPDEEGVAENATTTQKPTEPKFKVRDKIRIVKGDVFYGRIGEVTDIDFVGHLVYYKTDRSYEWLKESDLEPYTEPKEEDSGFLHGESVDTLQITSEESHLRKLSQDSANCDKEFDNILKDSFSKERRLNIAAIVMQGILSNADRMKQYGEIAMRESDSLTQLVARNAMRYADALIAECERTEKLKGE